MTARTLIDVEFDSFSVIYSADWRYAPIYGRVHHFAPPAKQLRRIWVLTERADKAEDTDYPEEYDRHRKWCGLLTPAQFTEFVEHCGLYPEETPTMGMLGAPGFGMGWAPAMVFDCEGGVYGNGMMQAYVCPILKHDPGDYFSALREIGDDQMFPPDEAEVERAWDLLWQATVEKVMEVYSW